jgi:hypothetical protein
MQHDSAARRGPTGACLKAQAKLEYKVKNQLAAERIAILFMRLAP